MRLQRDSLGFVLEHASLHLADYVTYFIERHDVHIGSFCILLHAFSFATFAVRLKVAMQPAATLWYEPAHAIWLLTAIGCLMPGHVTCCAWGLCEAGCRLCSQASSCSCIAVL